MIKYPCQCCGKIVEQAVEWIDSGTTLFCPECDGQTVIDLWHPDQRKTFYEAAADSPAAALPDLIAVCEEVARNPYPDSDPASLLETLKRRAESVLRLVNKSDINVASSENGKPLIAAAPDLLAACQAFVEAWEKSLQLEKTDVALRMAKQAIEKAQPQKRGR